MEFQVSFYTEKTFNLNGVDNTFEGTVHLVGNPSGRWSFYDIEGDLIEDLDGRCELLALEENPHTAKALMAWLKQDKGFCELAEEKVIEEYYDHVGPMR